MYIFLIFLSFTDTNPLQLSDQVVYLPYDIKSETLVTNVTVTGRLESLIQPLLFYMENVTQQQLSRIESKRKRRDIDDFCEGAGTVKPMSYFCVHRLTGGIEVTDDFQFKNGDEFDVKIRVTDSDHWGKTENTAKIKFISRDNCKEIRAFYKDASRECSKNASSAKGLDSCPSGECLRPLFDWLKRLNSSEMLQMECSFDPDNLANLARMYSKCIGKSRVKPFLVWARYHHVSSSRDWIVNMIGFVSSSRPFVLAYHIDVLFYAHRSTSYYRGPKPSDCEKRRQSRFKMQRFQFTAFDRHVV